MPLHAVNASAVVGRSDGLNDSAQPGERHCLTSIEEKCLFKPSRVSIRDFDLPCSWPGRADYWGTARNRHVCGAGSSVVQANRVGGAISRLCVVVPGGLALIAGSLQCTHAWSRWFNMSRVGSMSYVRVTACHPRRRAHDADLIRSQAALTFLSGGHP